MQSYHLHTTDAAGAALLRNSGGDDAAGGDAAGGDAV